MTVDSEGTNVMKHTLIWLSMAALVSVGLPSCALPVGMTVDAATLDFVQFDDPDSDFATMDVRDIGRFDAAKEQMISVADSLTFEGLDVEGNRLGGGFFTVRFGTEDGQRKAYFTETDPPTICDIVVRNEVLTILPADVTVPQG